MDRSGMNCLSFWYPRLDEAAVPVPKTYYKTLSQEMIRDMWSVLDGAPLPSWWDNFIVYLRRSAEDISATGPWFLRTGVFSGKHDWENCCAVKDLNELTSHVMNIFEMSQIVDFMGLPCNVWAVREWLHGDSLLEYKPFGNMPIRREFRAFAEEGKINCIHPYWPAEALDAGVSNNPEFQKMNDLGVDEDEVRDLVTRASKALPGIWSIDCLSTDNGWYVTDVAVAEQSYHWPNCPNEFKMGHEAPGGSNYNDFVDLIND